MTRTKSPERTADKPSIGRAVHRKAIGITADKAEEMAHPIAVNEPLENADVLLHGNAIRAS